MIMIARQIFISALVSRSAFTKLLESYEWALDRVLAVKFLMLIVHWPVLRAQSHSMSMFRKANTRTRILAS